MTTIYTWYKLNMNLKDFIALKFISIMFIYLDSFIHEFYLNNMEKKNPKFFLTKYKTSRRFKMNLTYSNVGTLTLGSRPRHGLVKVRVKNMPRSHISCSRECKRVWKNEPTHSQMNSHFGSGVTTDSRIFKGQLQGSKLIRLRSSFYHWKALGA